MECTLNTQHTHTVSGITCTVAGEKKKKVREKERGKATYRGGRGQAADFHLRFEEKLEDWL